jgi:hypothetical protein
MVRFNSGGCCVWVYGPDRRPITPDMALQLAFRAGRLLERRRRPIRVNDVANPPVAITSQRDRIILNRALNHQLLSQIQLLSLKMLHRTQGLLNDLDMPSAHRTLRERFSRARHDSRNDGPGRRSNRASVREIRSA